MTVEELIRKLESFPPEMIVKVASIVVEDIHSVVQDGEDFVKVVLKWYSL